MGYVSHPPENKSSGSSALQNDISEQSTLATKTAPPANHTSKSRFFSTWPLRRKIILFSCLGLFILTLGIVSPFLYQGYTKYQQDKALAQSGVQDLQAAEKLLKPLTEGSIDSHAITQAQQDFAKANATFSQLKNDVEQIPGVVKDVPSYGGLLSSAQKLVPLALEASQAGVIGCDALGILSENLHGVLSTSSPGLTMKQLTTVKNDVAQLQSLLNTATSQINQLQPSDLQVDSRLGPALATFRSNLPNLRTGLEQMQSFLSIAPTLLGIGQPGSFLIEQLDSTEIRPGGGFIGNYGVVTFANGKLADLQMRDTYLLDDAFLATGQNIPFPPAYTWFPLASSWSLRDSNLDADFPTEAQYAEQLYQTEGGTVSLQGVIAITPWIVQNALKITGPIYLPEYQETITADNVVDRIHFHQLKEEWQGGDIPSPDGHSSVRKRFTEILFEHFFARVRQIAPTATSQFVSLFYNALRTKDLQVYFNAPAGENLLQQYQLASTIQAPSGDGLLIVDANINGNKASYLITHTLQDQVTIDGSGNAIHHTTLTYTWPASANTAYGNTNQSIDYIRIYIPPDGTLLTQAGWNPDGTSTAFKRDVLAGTLTLPYGQTIQIGLTWSIPGAATHDTSGWHYHYLLQRQAGITWNLSLQVSLPSCAKSAPTSNKLAFNKAGSGILTQNLTNDLNINVNYSC